MLSPLRIAYWRKRFRIPTLQPTSDLTTVIHESIPICLLFSFPICLYSSAAPKHPYLTDHWLRTPITNPIPRRRLCCHQHKLHWNVLLLYSWTINHANQPTYRFNYTLPRLWIWLDAGCWQFIVIVIIITFPNSNVLFNRHSLTPDHRDESSSSS